MTEKQFKEALKRIEERLIRYTQNLISNGHPEAAMAVGAVREAFSQELFPKAVVPK